MRLLAICLAFLASCSEAPDEPKPSAREVRQACEAWDKARAACAGQGTFREFDCISNLGIRPSECPRRKP